VVGPETADELHSGARGVGQISAGPTTNPRRSVPRRRRPSSVTSRQPRMRASATYCASYVLAQPELVGDAPRLERDLVARHPPDRGSEDPVAHSPGLLCGQFSAPGHRMQRRRRLYPHQ
jgi:hypothetical protein